MTEIAGRHEAQLGTGNRNELAPSRVGFRSGEDIERSPQALREEDDGARVILIMMAVVVDFFVRLRRSCQNREEQYERRCSGRGDAAEIFGETERGGLHSGVQRARIMPNASRDWHLIDAFRR